MEDKEKRKGGKKKMERSEKRKGEEKKEDRKYSNEGIEPTTSCFARHVTTIDIANFNFHDLAVC